MEMEYSKKDIKKAPKIKSGTKIVENNDHKLPRWGFNLKGQDYWFSSEENAKIALGNMNG